MSYKIIIDSCGEFTEEMEASGIFEHVALTLTLEGVDYVDDSTFNQLDFIQKVKESNDYPRSACPSPGAYLSAIGEGVDRVYIVTLSGKLSGSYNSAMTAKKMYEEEGGKSLVYVFNSKSASVGETLIGLKIKELEEAGLSFEEVIEKTLNYIENQNTYFVLETLETFRKNGRINNIEATLINVLNIKPVMKATAEGDIERMTQARGVNKALEAMAKCVIERTKDIKNKVLAISHCNNPERAEKVKKLLMKAGEYKDIIVLNMAGVSTCYANDGGIIVVI